MDIVEATDILTACPTLEDVGQAAGVSGALIRQARMDRASPSYRKPPTGWQTAVAKLARQRAAELMKLADRLERGG